MSTKYEVIKEADPELLNKISIKWGQSNTKFPFIYKPFDKGWFIKYQDKVQLYVPNYVHHLQHHPEYGYVVFTPKGTFRGYTVKENESNALLTKDVKQAVQDWELKKLLTPDTFDTFGDLIEHYDIFLEAKKKFVVKCLKRFWLPDVYPHEDEHFAYECTLNGKNIIIGEEPADSFRYVFHADMATYSLYRNNKDVIAPLIAKAIDEYELKNQLSPDTRDTFQDMI